MKNAISSLGLACGIVAALVLLPSQPVEGAVKERVYTFDDAGAVAGQLPAVLPGGTRRGTNDTQPSTADFGNYLNGTNGLTNHSFVPLLGSGNTTRIPLYANAADRPGATAGNLGMQFDGIDDSLYCANPEAPTTPYLFDPRDFNFRFEVLSQAWVKSTATTYPNPQYVWRVGNELGGVYISTGGKWAFQTAADTPPYQIETNVSVQPNVWTHLFLFRGGNQTYLYINGQIAGYDAQYWGGQAPDVRLGADVLGPAGTFFQGVIDNFNIGTLSDGVFNATTDIDYFHDIGQTFSGITGDVNQDGVVNAADYQIWSQHLGFNNGFGLGDPATLLLGDVDRSGVVDLTDFQIIKKAALAAGNGSAVFGVPEPGTISLLLIGAAILVGRRAKHCNCVSRRTAWMALLTVFVPLLGANSARAAVVVAEDFLYDGATKPFGEGGGFNGLQFYQGGQNGSAGTWLNRWQQGQDGLIVADGYVGKIVNYPNDTNPVPHSALLDASDHGESSFLTRDFALAASVPLTQTLYFGGRFETDNVVYAPVVKVNSPLLYLNRVRGVDSLSALTQRDRTKDIALGFQDNQVLARLGADPSTETPNQVMSTVATSPPNDGSWHTLVGKLEVNAVGNNERLTVWCDPTGVESGGTSVQIQGDILTDLSQLLGTFDSQAYNPRNPDDPEKGRVYMDDIAIGTTWQDVTSVAVPRLTLQINRTNGKGTLINNSTTSLVLDGYSIESAAGSLNPANNTGWKSLQDQSVTGWQENLATTNRLAETALTTSTTITAGGQLALGNLFTTGHAEDVKGRISTTDGLVNLLNVQFITAPAGVIGDYNNNGIVDAADYTVWRDHTGSAFTLPNRDPLNGGNVNVSDYTSWKTHFGQTGGSGAGAASAVPEPSSLCLLLASVIGIGLRSAARCSRR
jgi:hypothetical protein